MTLHFGFRRDDNHRLRTVCGVTHQEHFARTLSDNAAVLLNLVSVRHLRDVWSLTRRALRGRTIDANG